MALEHHPLLAEVDPAVLDAARARFERVEAEPGEVLLRQAASDRTFLLVESGTVTVRRTERGAPGEGRMQNVAEVGPGEVVGELAALRGRPRSADVVARSRVVAHRGSGALLLDLCRADDALFGRVARVASSRLAGFAPPTEVALADRTLRIRPLLPSDHIHRVEARESVSARSLELRFLTPHPSESVVAEMLDVDFDRHFAWIVLDADDRYVASGRYVRLPDEPACGELGFLVADDHQGRGVGSLLLGALAVAARVNGVERFHAETRAGNAGMRALLGKVGGRWVRSGGDLVHSTVEVPDPAGLIPAGTVADLESVARLLAQVPHP